VVSSILPVVASSAAIPSQALTLTYAPLWSVALFGSALVFTCGLLWMLKNVERRSRSVPRRRTPVSLGFPPPPRHAIVGAGRHAA
jgi:hypothetical protein